MNPRSPPIPTLTIEQKTNIVLAGTGPLLLLLTLAASDDPQRRREPMDEQEPRKRQTTRLSREARDRRIFERARESFRYNEIGREEG